MSVLVDDPLVLRWIPDWPAASPLGPGVVVPVVSCSAWRGGVPGPLAWGWRRVPVDFAGDLSHRAEAYFVPSAGRGSVTWEWHVVAVGFVLPEALDALDAALARL